VIVDLHFERLKAHLLLATMSQPIPIPVKKRPSQLDVLKEEYMAMSTGLCTARSYERESMERKVRLLCIADEKENKDARAINYGRWSM
jgi:hypothetical protein